MSQLKALLLSDGRPGHYHLSEGVLAAVARRCPVATARVDVRRRPWMVGRLLAALVNAGAPPGLVLRLGYGVSPGRLPRADLVVSAGGDTLAANIAAARLFGASNIATNIFYGSLRRFRPEDFALVLTSHARNADRPRHVMTLKPSAADPDAFLPPASARGVNAIRTPAVAGLLLGGNTTAIRFEREDWQRLETFLGEFTRATGTRWFVSNSRRTPKEASDGIARLASRPESPILRFIDVARAGSGTLGELFARSEAILCTVDSSSMLSEAVWMRRPVIAIAPVISSLSAQEQEYRDYLAANGWARAIAIADLSPERIASLLGEITPLRANALERLAATLAEKLPQLFPTPTDVEASAAA